MFANYFELYEGYVQFYEKALFSEAKQEQDLDILSHVGHFRADANQSMQAGDPLLTSKDGPAASSHNFLGHLQNVRNSVKLDSDSTKKLVDGGREIVLGHFNSLTVAEWLNIVLIALAMVVAKRQLTRLIQRSTYIDSLGLRPKDRERLDECIWRLIYYTFSSTWLIYSCFLKRDAQMLLSRGSTLVKYSFTVDWDERLICMLETGFYLHATYALFWEDVWRRDSPMMIVHHLAAIFSVLGFYSTRTHQIGLTAVVLRDTCDSLLEVIKLAMCLRIQHNKVLKSFELFIKCALVVFTVAFVVNQLYYYPLFCLYHALNMTNLHQMQTPTIVGVLTCALIFLLLDWMWFTLIVRLLYRMIFTNAPLKDLREYEEELTGNNIIASAEQFHTDSHKKVD